MLHPSYTDLIKVANEGVDKDNPLIVSRYSIVHATAKRARQIVDERKEEEAQATDVKKNGVDKKALSVAVEEIESGGVKIVG